MTSRSVSLSEIDLDAVPRPDVDFEIRLADPRRSRPCVPSAVEAALTSVSPKHVLAPSDLLDVLNALGWNAADLNPDIPPALALAGAWHLVIAVTTAERLAQLEYDFDRLKELMLDADLTTLQLLWREHPTLFHARDPFPVGGVVEDAATGAAAAAFGGNLRLGGTRQMAPARSPTGLVVGHFADPEGHLIGVAGTL